MDLDLFDDFGGPADAAQKKQRLDTTKHATVKVDEATPAASQKPAKEYKFQLDSFQQEAVNYIEKGESVLVAAHTSAGKTAVAEYAIAKSLRDKQRVVYTSPIKALSNQKYRDLQEEFQDVGLMTGDMTINPNAACLIMTTGKMSFHNHNDHKRRIKLHHLFFNAYRTPHTPSYQRNFAKHAIQRIGSNERSRLGNLR